MGRFTPTDENLRIEVDESSVEPYAAAAVRILVRSGERKVYFLAEGGRSYPSLMAAKDEGVTVVSAGQEPSNFLTSSRVLHRDGELVVVSSKVMRKDQWRKLASEIEAQVAGASSAP